MASEVSGAASAHSSAVALAGDAVRGFLESRRRCVAVSLAYSTLLFAVCSVAWVSSGVNDDWVISNLLSGNWPGEQGMCLFVNAALTQLIYGLNQMLPAFNWFYIIEGATAYLAFFAIVYLSLSRMRFACAMLSIGAATILVLPGCTYEANFTYVAGIASAAGCMALISWLKDGRGASLVVAGVAFVALSSLWRWNMFLLSLPLYGVSALMVLFSENGDATLARRIIRLWPFALALAVCGFAHLYDTGMWSQSEWQEWYQFNEARSAYSDYEHRPYDEIAGELAEIGVSENDYELLDSWMHEDPGFFTAERLNAVSEIAAVRNDTAALAIKAALAYLASLLTAPKMAFVFASTLIVALGTLRGRERRMAVALIILAVVIAVALAVAGRLPARVRYPLWAFAITSFALLPARRAVGGEVAAARAGTRGGERLALACSTVAAAVPVVAVCFVLASALPNLSPERMQPIFDADGFEPESAAIDYVHGHPDDIFVVNTSSNSIIMYAHLVIAPYDEDLVARLITVGGWAARSPYSEQRNMLAGMENPVKGLVDNENALYVGAGPKSAELLCTYLREHYYADARFEQVDLIDGGEGATTLYVYKFFER